MVDASPLQSGGLLKLEAPGSDQEEHNPHQQQESNLRKDLSQASVFGHDAVIAFESVSVGGKF